MKMNSILSDLDDFLAPAQECIILKPKANNQIQEELKIPNEGKSTKL